MMRDELKERCGRIEECYEFMLAYAAQGLSGDAGSQTGGQLRELLSGAAAALGGLSAQYAALVESDELEPREKYDAFLQVLGRDAVDALAAIELVLAQRSIGSQLVDNLNASMHIRVLLTDIFLIDEVLKSQTTESPQTSKPSFSSMRRACALRPALLRRGCGGGAAARSRKSVSTLFIVWEQNRGATIPVGTRASIGDMFDSITAPGDHVLAVKTTFWISPR